MYKHKSSTWWLVAVSLLVLVSFVGCEMAGYDITQLDAESRKGKAPSTSQSSSIDPAPTVYWGTDGNLLLDPAAATYEYLADHVYLTVGETGIVSPAQKLFDGEGKETHEYIGYRFLGFVSSDFSLWAGQTNDAGRVSISNDGVNFYVEIDTNGLADVQEFHINAYASVAGLPSTRPAPGQAPFKLENVNSDSVIATIPLSYFGASANMAGSYYFIIHTALTADAEGSAAGSLDGETAYAGGNSTPSYNGKGAWFYIVGYTVKPMYELIYKPVEQTGGNDGDSFPEWAQDISNVVLVFEVAGYSDNDGYYTVKFEGFNSSDSADLDDMIDGILAFLATNDPVISNNDSVLLGAVIKGGVQITRYFGYGTGDNEPDELPAGIGFSLDGTHANVNPTSAIDVSYSYGLVR